ncbi:hypothetical protein KZ810_15755 [Sphingomonas sp. RHCKR47]|uniref:hypothetical protein n=1 Tax=Sphingomonas citricola TaxID=2862498 RepID=UPI001CA5422A|nr:hypothetical protein [Sphingomonas citricola]MBW6524953.1 hypothetical protein [Sphingomonas citricola]
MPVDARVPHHSTFRETRHGRFRDAGIFRILLVQAVRRFAGAWLIAYNYAAINASFLASEMAGRIRCGMPTWPRAGYLARFVNMGRIRPLLRRHSSMACCVTSPLHRSRTRMVRAHGAGPFGYPLNVLID